MPPVPVLCSRIMLRRLLLPLLTVGCLAATAQTSAPTQPQLSPLTITITDPIGAVIARAFVEIRSDSLERENPQAFHLEVRTDSNGEARASLPAGFYDVFAASTGFAPTAKKMQVRDGIPVALRLVLQVDELMTDEYGDRISAADDPLTNEYFRTSDEIKIHYIEGGDKTNPTLLFIPGWTMPASIWRPQLEKLWRKYHVIAVDPRSQGESDTPSDGNYPQRRSRDFEELMEHLQLRDVTLVGWSMGVLETLVYANQFGTSRLHALVLVDGFIALDPKDSQVQAAFAGMLKQAQLDRPKWTEAFVRNMYRKPQSEDYLRSVIRASLRTPTNTAVTLMQNMATMGDLSPMLAKLDKPVLFAYEPQLAATAQIVKTKLPSARIENFEDAGHALFVDDAERFNKLVEEFVTGAGHQPTPGAASPLHPITR